MSDKVADHFTILKGRRSIRDISHTDPDMKESNVPECAPGVETRKFNNSLKDQLEKPEIDEIDFKSSVHYRSKSDNSPLRHRINREKNNSDPGTDSHHKEDVNHRDEAQISEKDSSPEYDSDKEIPKQTSQQGISIVHIFCTTAFVLLIAWIIAFRMNIFNVGDEIIKPVNLTQDIRLLSKKFPDQDREIWDYLSLGIENMIPSSNNTNVEPAIFFLIQWSDNNDTATEISKAVGDIAIRYSDGPHGKLLVLSPNDINSLEHGELISKYENQLKSNHVMIIREIEKVMPNVAQDLRYFCDEENPITPEAAIFLIMNVAECNGAQPTIFDDSKRNAIRFVEKCLTEKWGKEDGLGEDILRPLLTRIVNILLPIHS